MRQRVWAEIDLDIIKDNYSIIKQKANGSKICCVVKDNAYGHGYKELAKLYEKLGADYFAVSNIDEAIELRDEGIDTPILILGYTPIDRVNEINKYSITQCVYSLEYAKELGSTNINLLCHLKVDTGMNRIGFKNVDEMIDALNIPNLEYEGIFTHFAYSENDEVINKQFKLFKDYINKLDEHGYTFKIKHCANSISLFRHPEYNLDMVRPGIVLYGLEGHNGLKQALKLKSIISHIKYIDKGETVGYNCEFVATKDMKIATIPIGYGDGYLRCNKNKNTVSINGKDCPIVGNICMDQMMVDISDVDASLYDEVEIYGDLEKIAKNINTISYELICLINKRVPIIYKSKE